MSDITVDRIGSVARIAVERPQAMNALREATFRELTEALAELGADPAVRALVLTGSGRAFSAGADLADPMMGGHLPPAERGEACRATIGGLMNPLMQALRDAPFPTIAAVNGVAAGGGVGLALACDMVLAARSAKFILTVTPKLGLVPDLGSTWHLARHLGRARAMGLMLTGEPVTAERAVELGLIWKVVDDAALADDAMALASQLAAGPRKGQVAARGLLDRAFENDFATQLDAERDAQASLVGGAEVIEALEAFSQKRAPDFVGAAKGDLT
jgi:2-(1,2-epoxy-1,2-dihydrophenyl)acetyl-CoA isomerase